MHFKTKDFYLAALLFLKKYPLRDHEEDNGKTVFYFQDSDELRDTVQDYFYDQLTVSPHQYQEAIKMAKSIIYSSV